MVWPTFAPPITVFIYIHGDELSCRLPATPSRLGIVMLFTFSLLSTSPATLFLSKQCIHKCK
ncbi:hypothetical protein FXE69_17735 [Vibrio cholerae]|nr:hypothetical protein [Vibrio cholerae]RBM62170.1 hypothetical protein DLR71_10370 [Vibrio paracholerae]EGR0600434.1 hypothetical protein [Vibrio cholerae]EGR3920217.1 hypothetical protein [Vibrio cholerae]MVC38533.1 hypothetical protein [Vibrio cholerae]